MKKILLIAFSCLIPSAHAVDYVKCEAIRAVISRNSIQKQEAFKEAYDDFEMKKIREKYGKGYCEYGSETYNECSQFSKNVWKNFKDEGIAYRQDIKKPYEEINDRAVKDFEKNGCYWF